MKRVLMKRYGPSIAGRLLARALGIKMLLHNSSRFRPTRDDIIINWGDGKDRLPYARYINAPEAIAQCTSKIKSFKMFNRNDIPCPDWTTSKATAAEWIDDGKRVLARACSRGSQGKGIVAYSKGGSKWTKNRADFRAAGKSMFYVKIFGEQPKGIDEYRVHVINGHVIDGVMKKKRNKKEGDDKRNPYIRSWNNGWIFARQNVRVPENVCTIAIRAVEALGLDFGAVDIACENATGQVCVYEVNTAPGIEGTTLTLYVQAFKEWLL